MEISMNKSLVKFSATVSSLIFISTSSAWAVPETPEDTWVPNGAVQAILPAGNRVYISGDFNWVGPSVGRAVPFNSTTGSPKGSYPEINGGVKATLSVGSDDA